MKNIEIASNEKLKFNSIMETIFLNDILGFEALVTDESRLCDFISLFDIHYAKSVLENGNCIFELKTKKDLFSKEYETVEVEEEPSHDRDEIIKKAKNILGVDITGYFNLELPVLFLQLQKEISRDKKIELGLI